MAAGERYPEMREKLLLDHLNSFLAACSGSASSISNVDKVQCATVLLSSLPCARHAVLEQLCDVFDESMHKFMVEMERRAQLGGDGGAPDIGADLDNALHKICDVLRNFTEANPKAWALIICKWCLNLMGDLISKFDQKRGVSLTLSFSEGFHKWMAFPPIQMLMGITTHCCSKLVISSPDACMETFLQIAMRYSPHLDWVVAHIVSQFHDVIVDKLLSTALKDYAASYRDESEEKSVLVSTVVQVLGYLSLQFAPEIREHLLSLFHRSVLLTASDDQERAEQLATTPFLLHIASLSPKLLKGTLTNFAEVFTPGILCKLYEQSLQRAEMFQTHGSLTPALVDIITNIETGAYDIFQFLLNHCCPPRGEEPMDTDGAQTEVQKAFILIMEKLLIKLRQVSNQRHKLYTQKSAIAPLDSSSTESAFLHELIQHSGRLFEDLMSVKQSRFAWVCPMAVVMAIHGGEPVAVDLLCHILMRSDSNDTLNVLLNVQSELETYYPSVLRETIRKCAGVVTVSTASLKPWLVCNILQNLFQIMQAELYKTLPPRVKLTDCLQEHYEALGSLAAHSHTEVAVYSMGILRLMQIVTPPSAANRAGMCRAMVSSVFRGLKQLANNYEDFDSCKGALERLEESREILTEMSRDQFCRLVIIRLLVESALEKGNAKILGNTEEDDNDRNELMEDSRISLLEHNLNPQISSRLTLSPSSVFFTGVIGNKKPTTVVSEQSRAWAPASQVYFNLISAVCRDREGPSDEGLHRDQPQAQGSRVLSCNTDHVASLLMETVCPDVVPCVGEWPDDDFIKYNIERNLKTRKTFDKNPILWWLLVLVSRGGSSLCKCSPLMSSLLATIMSCWEVCRDTHVTQSSDLFKDTQIVTQVITEAGWLPAPISRVGGVLHLLSPQEIYAVLNAMWKVLKEYPPHPSWYTDQTEQRWQQGAAVSQKEVLKAIFINNISTLGQHYPRVFQQ
ncbi:integrator complex subunit 5 isoform X2 [Nematostella vectensis]|uniref:integrator complex subunit 5 isoform X2 n=1 Tax=Nematostella vectensis TaxID=45351 RepID=UPI00138FB0A6|nr:integrator complex subunit 5 isoform X2 [Nematostella vectensis]